MTLDLFITLTVLVISAVGAGLMIWMEYRPREPGNPSLVPTTPLLFVCALIVVLALAHLMTIVTGSPHVGRFGSYNDSSHRQLALAPDAGSCSSPTIV